MTRIQLYLATEMFPELASSLYWGLLCLLLSVIWISWMACVTKHVRILRMRIITRMGINPPLVMD